MLPLVSLRPALSDDLEIWIIELSVSGVFLTLFLGWRFVLDAWFWSLAISALFYYCCNVF